MEKISLIQKVHTYITAHQLLPPGSKVVIGLSGGPDSVFLLHLFANLSKEHSITLIAAHLDHEWRVESAHDVEFCRSLAQSLDIQFIARKISDLGLTLKFNGSKEEIARKARRHFFDTVKIETGADTVALAHHAQDQQETFFIRMLRGATLTGLTAMKAQQSPYIRPLLHTNKSDILDYLNTHDIAYLIDSTNSSDAFLRNRIRMNVLPALQNCDARFDANFLSTITRLQETESFLQELTAHIFEQISQYDNEVWQIDVEKLLALHAVMRYRIILYWLCAQNVPFSTSQSFFDEMLRFLDTPDSKSHQMNSTWRIVKKKNLAWIEIA
ncbi:MAG: tRNA lysidine(34) synthetase TilS [Candidatus Babeliales bacterium]|nr:tRNA lysidine(34) synthetase TilS [Candidatus Babeliales bacterium]